MSGAADLATPQPTLEVLQDAERHATVCLAEAGFRGERIPPVFASRAGVRDTALHSRRWTHPSGLDARCCLIRSSQVEVLNLMIFPRSAEVCPVFASEIIVFGRRVRVAVIDHQAADPASELRRKVEAALAVLHDHHHRRVSPGGELPEWAKEHFTPMCIYSRPTDESETAPLCTAFAEYLDAWVARWLPLAVAHDSAADHLGLYLRHHIASTPGRPFLSAAFGGEWTERYLEEFMYALPETISTEEAA